MRPRFAFLNLEKWVPWGPRNSNLPSEPHRHAKNGTSLCYHTCQGNVNRNDKKYNDASEASKCELWKRFKKVRRDLGNIVGYGFEEWDEYDCEERDVGKEV